MPWAAFVIPKNKHRSIDPPCLDPLDFGVGDEPSPTLLMRRGRVGLFLTREDVEREVKCTLEACRGQQWTKDLRVLVMECMER